MHAREKCCEQERVRWDVLFTQEKRQSPRQARRGDNTAYSNKQQERRRASEVARQGPQGSRGDGKELLFGDSVVQGGLNGGLSIWRPGRARWRVLRVAVECVHKLLGMVTWPTRGFQNEWDQVHTGVPVKLFLFSRLARVAWVGSGRRNEPSIGTIAVSM